MNFLCGKMKQSTSARTLNNPCRTFHEMHYILGDVYVEPVLYNPYNYP